MPRPTIYRLLGSFLKQHDEKKYAYKRMLEDEYYFSIKFTRLVSSRGLLSLCDIKPANPTSSYLDEEYVRSIPALINNCNHQETPIVYLTTDAIDFFASNCLAEIRRSFTLVTGDSDISLNALNVPRILQLINSDTLTAWFAQNVDYINER